MCAAGCAPLVCRSGLRRLEGVDCTVLSCHLSCHLRRECSSAGLWLWLYAHTERHCSCGRTYQDASFPAETAIKSQPGATSSSGSGSVSSGTLQFVRPKPNQLLFNDKLDPTSLLYAQAGNHWLVSALMAMGTRSATVHNLLSNRVRSSNGKYVVRLYDGFSKSWKKIQIDDAFPAREQSAGYIQPDGDAIWPLVLEKAFAKLLSGYEMLSEGSVAYGMQAFTGDEVLRLSKCKKDGTDADASMEFEVCSLHYFFISGSTSGVSVTCLKQTTLRSLCLARTCEHTVHVGTGILFDCHTLPSDPATPRQGVLCLKFTLASRGFCAWNSPITQNTQHGVHSNRN